LHTKQYRAAGGVVVDEATDHVLVLRRPGRLGPGGQPEVRLPKGHVEPGESDLTTAVREVAEEAGLPELDVVADLGEQRVEFDWQGTHYVRHERYFLLRLLRGAAQSTPEAQFERWWLPWQVAIEEVTFEVEREWLRRARATWRRSS